MTEQQSTMVCPRCGVWRNLDPAVEYCLDCGEGKVLHKCPRCDKEFQQLSGSNSFREKGPQSRTRDGRSGLLCRPPERLSMR
jgi:DNA-directed RNA polymerase subunit RPC12/RpoP